MSWPRDGTQPHPLDCCETGLESYDVSITGHISEQEWQIFNRTLHEIKIL